MYNKYLYMCMLRSAPTFGVDTHVLHALLLLSFRFIVYTRASHFSFRVFFFCSFCRNISSHTVASQSSHSYFYRRFRGRVGCRNASVCRCCCCSIRKYFVLFLVIDFHASSAIKDAMSKRMHCCAAYGLLLFTFFVALLFVRTLCVWCIMWNTFTCSVSPRKQK